MTVDSTQSGDISSDRTLDWDATMERLNEWANRLTEARDADVLELQALCVEGFVSLLGCDGGWLWGFETLECTLIGWHGQGAKDLGAEVTSDRMDVFWQDALNMGSYETATVWSERVASQLGAFSLAVPIQSDLQQTALMIVFRHQKSFCEKERQISRTMALFIQGALMAAQGRTQLRSQKRDMAEALSESQAAVESKGQFLATMSHEIRTPMNGILGMTQLLMDTSLDPEQREFLNTVHSSAKSLLTIINDVLDFSKVDAGRLQLDPVEFDVVNMLEEVTSLVSERSDPKGLDLFCFQPEALPGRFVGDEGRIRQILINLVGNAVKFTMDGQVVIRTTVESSVGDAYVLRFEVEDTGIGISPDKVDTLFQSFVQADNSTTRRFGGTGLGLAISKRLVELLGGEMGVRSGIGQGSTFWFTVAIDRIDTPKRALEFAPELRGKSLWVGVENPMVLRALEQVVESHGVRVHGFQSKLELETAIQSETVDFVLFGERGLDWTRESFAMALWTKHQVPLLALLRNSERHECRRGGDSPWSGSVIRPFRGSLVLHALRGLKRDPTGSRKMAVLPKKPAEITQLIRPTKVLLVEDSPVNRTIALKMLSKMGFAADVAHNGLEAVEACKDIEYDIVLMDCLMPIVDGYQATQRIRKHFGNRRGPVIVALTANAMPEDRQKCLDVGMDDYLQKPFSPAVILSLIERWIVKVDSP